MNDQDKFECRHQEIHDDNTNATVTFGAHAGSGHKWMRIAIPYADPNDPQKPGETKTSTITFGPDGQALKILPHVQMPDAPEQFLAAEDREPQPLEQPFDEEDDPKAKKIKEELAHLDEIEETLPDDVVDKPAKRSKK